MLSMWPVAMRSKRPNLAWITHVWFWDFQDKSLINSGFCYLWAWIAHLAHPEAKLCYWDCPTKWSTLRYVHAFVKIGDLYFDSSRPCGVRDWRRLKFFLDEEWGPGEFKIIPPRVFPSLFPFLSSERFRDQGLEPWCQHLPPHPGRSKGVRSQEAE